MRARWLLAILSLGLAVRLSVCAQDALQLADYPFTDDSFYSLNIARNIALGAGPTHDGRHLTNGFQPLYVLLMVPAYWLAGGDRIVPIYLAAVFLSLCSVGACYLLFQLARQIFGDRAGYIAIAPLLFTTYAVSRSVNGLETSLYILLLCATALHYATRIRTAQPAPRASIACGLLAGLTVWARIDGSFLLVAIFLDQAWLWTRHRRENGSAPLAETLSPFIRRNLLLLGIPTLAILPWLLFNLHLGGSPVPESGRAVRFLSRIYAGFPSGPVPLAYYAQNLREAVNVLFRHFLTDGWFLGWFRAVCGFSKGAYYGGLSVLLLGLAAFLGTKNREGLKDAWREWLKRLEKLSFLLLFSGLLIAAYSFYAFGPWFFGRYLFVVAFVVALCGGGLADFALTHLLRVRSGDWKDRLTKFLYAALILISALSTARTVRSSGGVSPWCTRVIPWIESNLPPGTTVGSFQSGYLGYFLADRPIAALDGVVDGTALQALQENRMIPHLRIEKVDYVVDWRWLNEDLLFGRSEKESRAGIEQIATLEGGNRRVDFLVYRVLK